MLNLTYTHNNETRIVKLYPLECALLLMQDDLKKLFRRTLSIQNAWLFFQEGIDGSGYLIVLNAKKDILKNKLFLYKIRKLIDKYLDEIRGYSFNICLYKDNDILNKTNMFFDRKKDNAFMILFAKYFLK